MEGRFGRAHTFTASGSQPTGINWLSKLKGLLEIRFVDAVTDATLVDCISAAIEHVENTTGRVIRLGLMRVSYECWVGRFPLPFLPFVSSLTVVGWDDAAIDFVRQSHFATIKAPNGCVLSYQAGYGDSCPYPLQQAVLKTALTMYEIRSNTAIGTISSVLPQSADEFMEPYILCQDS